MGTTASILSDILTIKHFNRSVSNELYIEKYMFTYKSKCLKIFDTNCDRCDKIETINKNIFYSKYVDVGPILNS